MASQLEEGMVSLSRSSSDRPSFFKIFLPEHHSRKLVIPPNFIKHFKGKIPKTASIRNFHGKFWIVGLKKNGDELCFRKGWSSYVNDHSLERGYVLLFKYTEKSVFCATVFGLNGCVKEEPLDKGIELYHQVKEEEQDDEMAVVTVVDNTRNSSKGLPEAGYLKSDRDASTNSICFVNFFGKTNDYMSLPIEIERTVNLKVPRNISIHNEDGTSCMVALVQRKDRVVLGSGYSNFRITNKIKTGDKGEFEVVLGPTKEIKEVYFKIIRAEK